MRLFFHANLILLAALAAGPAAARDASPGALAVPGGARTYDYSEDGVFAVIASPGRITDIQLEPGEALVGAGAIAAGDTARWVIGDTLSGPSDRRRVHVMIKPIQAGLATNLIINSDRRTYHLELRASGRTWFSKVAWRYRPIEAAVVIPLVAAPPEPREIEAPPEPPTLNLDYRIEGARPAWRPLRVYDDGRRTYVEFGPGVTTGDLPPLYLTGPDGRSVELVNYHVQGRRMVIDRLLDRAELRLGDGRRAQRVRITRRNDAGDGR